MTNSKKTGFWPTPNAVGDTKETPEHWLERSKQKRAENPNLGDLHLSLGVAVRMETKKKEETISPKVSQLTLFAEDSPANHFPKPGSDKAIKMTVTSGQNILGLYKKSDPVGLLAKMLLASSVWASTKCFLTWKVKTTPAKRLLFQLAPSMPRIEETEFGLLPTPRVSDTEGGRVKNVEMINGKYSRTNKKGVRWGVKLRDVAEEPRLFPTPKAQEPGTTSEGYGDCLNDVVHGRKGWGKQMLPTPTTREHKGARKLETMALTGRNPMTNSLGDAVMEMDGGQLNPEWVEWLMGFPIGWTDLNS